MATVALLVLNDHVLKARYPGILTGKISDFMGMFFFPLLLLDVARLALGARARRAHAAVCGVLTGVVFSAVKTWGPAHEAYCVGLGALQWPLRGLLAVVTSHALPSLARVRLAMDPTDLVALLALVPSYRYATRSSDAEGCDHEAQVGARVTLRAALRR